MKFLGSIFFSTRFYTVLFSVCGLFVFGYFIPAVFPVTKLLLIIAFGLIVTDFILLYASGTLISCSRNLPKRMSMDDANKIDLTLINGYSFTVHSEIIDEVPFQFQIRDFKMILSIGPHEEKNLSYDLVPKMRGDFEFGKTHVFVSSLLQLLIRRYTFNQTVAIPVYPSFIQMRKYELQALTNQTNESGMKKVKKPGKHSEFDQVREYVSGDDYRLMNWKTTAKKARLMVNQYQEERSKDVYNIIDMGRLMQMPFDGMSLLDYSINASLAISNIAILKRDKAGIITFSTDIESFIPAENHNGQMNKILETLYNQKTKFLESNYELLYMMIKKRLRQRSLILLYTNFESLISMQRHLPALQNLARNHLVLVVVFKNTDIEQMILNPVESLEEGYASVIAEKFIYEKKLIVKELNKYGIYAILTSPKLLTTGLINKYLEIKAGEKI